MLKRDPSGRFQYREVGIFNKKKMYRFRTGKFFTQREMSEEEYLDILARQQYSPVAVMKDSTNRKCWWMFGDEFYWEDEDYSQEEVKALVLERIEQKEKRVKRALTRVRQEASWEREPIPDDVKLFVWQRDRGCCVKCESNKNLEYDHIIPVSKGGSNTARNIQLLCQNCNRSKGGNLA
jgi:5-methylcytosine-specific restriction endonuclease McrA